MSDIVICEVGPRDALQNHPRHFSVAERVELIDRLASAGLRRIEAVSFVNDRKVPRMAGAEEVLAKIDRSGSTQFSGLVLNRRGVERALLCDLDEIRVVVVASDTFSQRNQGTTLAEMMVAATEIGAMVTAAGRRFSVVIATAFGCPFEGLVPFERVVGIARDAVAAGAQEIILADTIGAATPFQVAALLPLVVQAAGAAAVGCHFHNTRGLGFGNAYAAIEHGARILDAAIGGLGGCPFAPKATGNIATEDLAFMLRERAGATPLDFGRLLATVAWLEEKTGSQAPGMLSRAGLFPDQLAA